MDDLIYMYNRAVSAMRRAYAPYSQYKVGTCIKTTKGKYFTGCNVENVSYAMTQCAESNAISTMVNEGYLEIDSVAIIATGDGFCFPCGGCRQIIKEFAAKGAKVYSFTDQDTFECYSIDDLMPHSFDEETLRQ